MSDYWCNKEEAWEGELYAVLTEFMGVLRRFFRICEQICQAVGKPPAYQQHIDSLALLCSQFKALADSPNLQSRLSPDHHIYLRFTARLLEILSLTKNRQPHPSNICALYRCCLARAELIINSFKMRKDLHSLFKGLFHLSASFSEGCSIIAENGPLEQALQGISRVPLQGRPLSGLLARREAEVVRRAQTPTKPALSQSQRKLLAVSCMDVDCDYVASLILLGVSKKEEVGRMMGERNKHIGQIMNAYYKEFHYYLKRLERTRSSLHPASRPKLKHPKSINCITSTNTKDLPQKGGFFQGVVPQGKREVGNCSQQSSPVRKGEEWSQQCVSWFHPIKRTYLTFSSIEPQSVKSHKAPKNACFKSMQDAKKIKYILKNCKFPQHTSPKAQNALQQTAILEIKKLDLSAQVEKNNLKLLQLFSLDSQEGRGREVQEKWEIIDKDRRDKKPAMSRTSTKFHASPKDSSRTKTEVSIHQLPK